MSRIALTSEEVISLGHELSEVRLTVEMVAHMAETLCWVQQKDGEVFQMMAQRFLNTFCEQFNVVNDTLDSIAFVLMNATDDAELEAFNIERKLSHGITNL